MHAGDGQVITVYTQKGWILTNGTQKGIIIRFQRYVRFDGFKLQMAAYLDGTLKLK